MKKKEKPEVFERILIFVMSEEPKNSNFFWTKKEGERKAVFILNK